MLAVQGGLALALFLKKDFVHLPDDITGNEQKAWEFAHKNLNIVKWFSIAVLAVQLFSFALALSLRGIKSEAVFDSDDDEDGADVYERRYGGPRRPLLHRDDASSVDVEGTGAPGAGPSTGSGGSRNDSWSRRMRDTYGLETSTFTYDPSHPPPSRVKRGDTGEKSVHPCVIM